MFKPIRNEVLIKVKSTKDKTEGGIIIPDNAREEPVKGEVIALGSKCETMIDVGDLVIFDKYAGKELEIDGDSYRVISEENINGIEIKEDS